MGAAGDGLLVMPIDATKYSGQMLAAAGPVLQHRPQMTIIDGEQFGKQIAIEAELVPLGGERTVDVIEGFIPPSGRRAESEQVVIPADGGPTIFFNEKIVAHTVSDCTHHAHRIVGDALVSRADYPDDALVEVGHAAHVINNRAIFYFVEQGVDGEVAAQGILIRRTVGIVGRQNCFRAIDIVFAE